MTATPDPRPLGGPEDDGQTPLDPDEANGLRLAWIANRGDLNEAESTNIRRSERWARRQLVRADVASEDFLRALHRRMFGEVWDWAGTYRNSERNIGDAPHQIAVNLHNLFADVRTWRDFNVYPLDEQAVRLHQKLTRIHPFPNGNGRVSRAMSDYYLLQHGGERFTWGRKANAPDTRERYLEALRLADTGHMGPLLDFVRT